VQNLSNSELFKFHVDLVIDALKLQNKPLVKNVEELITNLLSYEYTNDIVMAALFELAETDPEIFRWTLHNFHDLNFPTEIIEQIVMFAINKLINKGLIFGRDFSVAANGRIFINQADKYALLDGISGNDALFLEEISQVIG